METKTALFSLQIFLRNQKAFHEIQLPFFKKGMSILEQLFWKNGPAEYHIINYPLIES